MAALLIAAAGSALGGALITAPILGLTGSAIGWIGGSLLAGAFAPGTKTEGPRLGDAQNGSSAAGNPIPFLIGHPRVGFEVVWQGPRREIATTTAQGKGGGGNTNTTYTYEQDVLLKVSDNPIAGVGRVWSYGELVYTALTSAGAGSITASAATNLWRRMAVYSGDIAQLPDPVYEASVGTPNALAFRGCGTIMLEGLQLDSSGHIPQLNFEVLTKAVTYDGATLIGNLPRGQWYPLAGPLLVTDTQLSAHFFLWSGTYTNSVTVQRLDLATGAVTDGVSYTTTTDGYSRGEGTANAGLLVAFRSALFNTYEYIDAAGNKTDFVNTDPLIRYSAWNGIFYFADSTTNIYKLSGNTVVATGATAGSPRNIVATATHVYVLEGSNIRQLLATDLSLVSIIAAPTTLGNASIVLVNEAQELFLAYKIGAIGYLDKYTAGVWVSISDNLGNCTPGEQQLGALVVDRMAVRGNTLYRMVLPGTVSGSGANVYASFSSIEITETTLREAVDALLERSGVDAADYDTSALAAITTPVRSMIVPPGAARAALELLMGTYFFTAVASDKIYYRPLGGAAAATIPYADMGWATDGTPPESLMITAGSELEIPAREAMTYTNVDGDYQTDTQLSDRLLTAQGSTSGMQVPIGFTTVEAKRIVDTRVQLGYIRSYKTQLTLGQEYSAIEPGDVILGVAHDGSTYRCFLDRLALADGIMTFDALLDDASTLVQPGITGPGPTSQTSVLPIAGTTLELLDIAILRDADDRTGHLVAVKGNAANWTSCGLYVSFDDVSYTQLATIIDQAVIGSCSTTLPAWAGGNVWDLSSTLTVDVGLGELVSYTEADVLNGVAPGYLIGNEIVYAQTATLVSAGVYTLSRFLRGRRGTEWAMAGHAAAERLVVLSTTGLRFIPMDASELGKLRYYKAVSAGQRLSDVVAQQITPMGVGLEPLAGVNARANRDTTDTALTWDRRTRLSTRITGPLAWSNPVGESPEIYEVDVYTDGTFTTVARTLTTSTPAVTYTSANQVTDFGSNQSVLYLRIYQLSATVGRGYVLQATI